MEERNVLYSVPSGSIPPSVDTTLVGTLWFDVNNGILYILYDDGESKQWIQASAPTYSPNV